MLGDFVKKHIYDSGDGKQKPATSSGSAPPTPGVLPAAVVPGGKAVAPTPAFADAGMIADIQKIIARRPTDFNTLEQQAQLLEPVISDELTRTKAAFQFLKVQGKSSASVISSIDLHIRDVQQEMSAFEQASKTAVTAKAGKLRQEADSLQRAIDTDEQRLQALQTQMEQIRATNAQRAADVQQHRFEADGAESEIQAKVAQFNEAAATVISVLNTKKSTLASMLA